MSRAITIRCAAEAIFATFSPSPWCCEACNARYYHVDLAQPEYLDAINLCVELNQIERALARVPKTRPSVRDWYRQRHRHRQKEVITFPTKQRMRLHVHVDEQVAVSPTRPSGVAALRNPEP